MELKNNIQFDELDLKCLSEMPLILDVIAATGNKITGLFKSLYLEMDELVKNNLKPNWKSGRKSNDCLIYPLTDNNEDGSKISIKSLESYFKIESLMRLEKMSGEKEENYFYAFYGYFCSKDENEPSNHFYFAISTGTRGIMNELKFYNQLKNKLIGYNIKIEHPEKGDDFESIELRIVDFSMEKIKDGFNIFKLEILTPFLNTVR